MLKCPVPNGQHSPSVFTGSMEQARTRVVLSLGRESRGRESRQIGEGRMTYMLFILAMGPMSAAGIYNPQVVDRHHHCIAEPGSFEAIYCSSATVEPAPHPHHKK